MTRIVLIVDGGGIRGIIPARVLVELRARLGRPLHEVVDLAVGTSTGGIIALGLAAGLEPSDMLALYVERGARIFKKHWSRRLRNFGWLTAMNQYPAGPLEEELKHVFGDAWLDALERYVMVVAFDPATQTPVLLRSWMREAHEWRVWEAARVTSAAPSYFRHYRRLWDGGVAHNAPVVWAWRAGRKLFPDDRLLMLSFGTGDPTRPIDPDRVKSKTQAATVIIPAMTNAHGHAAQLFLDGLDVPECAGRHRFQCRLELASDDLDDASPGNIQALLNEAELLIETRSDEIDQVVAQLKEN